MEKQQYIFEKNVLSPFLEIIENFGDSYAFCIAGKFYTYRELGKNISKIRKAIQSLNVNSKNVGIVANDDIETYASIFSLWLEGFAYVPLNPLQPVERNLEIISEANINLIINSKATDLFSPLQTINSSELDFDDFLLQPTSTPDNALVYILFTSGSTGKPKGVPITRSNISAFMRSFGETGIQVNGNDRCLQCIDLTFDVSVQAFLVPLTNGACVYTIPHDQIKFTYVYGLLENEKLTFAVMVPSMLRYLQPYFDELNVESLKYCILTAEASPVDLLKKWSACVPNAEMYNFYGPTEATIYCTYYKFNKTGINKHFNGVTAIGKVMWGLTAIIRDEAGNILGADEKGELCISGGQLTTGYWNNLQKTNESFFEIIRDGVACRFYKTGDLCFFDDEGDIMYAGRLDHQVKIQGYRIELGEIEYHAREFLQDQNAVSIPYENKLGNSEIALFVEGEVTDTTILFDYLKSKMPYYMVPTKILINEKFPLNVNGKTDRIMLKKLIKP